MAPWPLPRQPRGHTIPTDVAEAGFVKVDGKGVLDSDLYAAPDDIAMVTAGAVHLAVTADDLSRER